MGLDMYLTKELYVSRENRKNIAVAIDGVRADRIVGIVEEAITWRKTNAIHRWFVENVQDGRDDCHKYFVSIPQLKILLDTIEEVLQDKDKADVLLPTQPGFFFGDTEYDESYFDDLQTTKEALEEIMKSEGAADFYYQASW